MGLREDPGTRIAAGISQARLFNVVFMVFLILPF